PTLFPYTTLFRSQKAALYDPILHGTQVGQSEMRRSGQLITKDLARLAGLLNIGLRVVGKVDTLLKAERRLGVGEIEFDPVFERDSHEREAIERGRANDIDARCDGKTHLHRNRVV